MGKHKIYKCKTYTGIVVGWTCVCVCVCGVGTKRLGIIQWLTGRLTEWPLPGVLIQSIGMADQDIQFDEIYNGFHMQKWGARLGQQYWLVNVYFVARELIHLLSFLYSILVWAEFYWN